MAVRLWLPFRPQFLDSSGNPLSGALLFFYAAGTTTKQNTFTDDGGGTANANPLTLDANGRVPQDVWMTTGQNYKASLAAAGSADPPASFIFQTDDVSGINDATITSDQWVAGTTPTYVSATSFTLATDLTSTYHIGRRLKTTNGGGTIYSTITAVSFASSLTTVTVENDSGTLDASLSAVSYGALSATNRSIPILPDTVPIVGGSADRSKRVRFEVDGLTTATTRVITVPDADIALANWSTGDVKLTLKTAADAGWVMMNDGTIGNAASGGTTRANADTEALFTLLWNNVADAQAPVSSGRGANAAADFAANKNIALTKVLGRALGISGAGSGLTSRVLGLTTGNETETLTTAQLASHGHTDTGHAHTEQVDAGGAIGNAKRSSNAGGGPINVLQNSSMAGVQTPVDLATAAGNAAITNTGSGSAHANMQPTGFMNCMIKL